MLTAQERTDLYNGGNGLTYEPVIIPSGPIRSIPIGIPVQIAQNVVYALPTRLCTIIAEPACEVSQFSDKFWNPIYDTTIAVSYIRCTSASAIVTCKPMRR